MDHYDGVVEIERDDLELDATVVRTDPDQSSVCGLGRRHPGGRAASMTNIAWALPIR